MMVECGTKGAEVGQWEGICVTVACQETEEQCVSC